LLKKRDDEGEENRYMVWRGEIDTWYGEENRYMLWRGEIDAYFR
jgi:hypothetical protein